MLIIINCYRLLKYHCSLQRNMKVNINILLTKVNEIQKSLEMGRITVILDFSACLIEVVFPAFKRNVID